MALALGARVTLVTRLSTAFDRAALDGIELDVLPAGDVCRYANRYDDSGNRTGILLTEGEQIGLHDITPNADADAMIVAPAYHEVPCLPPSDARVVGVSLQGPLRTTGPDGTVRPGDNPAERAAPFIRPGVLAFFSEEDTADPEALARFVAARGGIALATRGYRGATLVAPGGEQRLPAIPASLVDPTGAGDCFATAFVVRYAETGSLDEASRFALAAGSLAVEDHGLAGVATRARVEERARQEAA